MTRIKVDQRGLVLIRVLPLECEMEILKLIHDLTWDDLPADVQRQARRCLLDTVGAGIGGRQTELSRIIFDVSAELYGGRGAHLWLDGRELSPAGAALANGMTIDSLDIHDGDNVAKGHAGAAVIPAAIAAISLVDGVVSGKELLTTIVIGYEISLRAGHTLHGTACDYHTSGAWNAIGCAAMVSRLMKLDHEQTRHALGIAEYHGPRSQMMRCIDWPTMLKDGSGWGAMAGITAGVLASKGFTGAPAVTLESAESAPFWDGLGDRWAMLDQYFKPVAVCRWAQAPIVGALKLQAEHEFDLDTIREVRVKTFHEGVRLAVQHPDTTEQAQYSLPFPVAAALKHGQLGPFELNGEGLRDPQVNAIASKVVMVESEYANRYFPGTRYANVEVELEDGTILDSGYQTPSWDSTDPPSDEELLEKFRWLARTGLSDQAADSVEKLLWNCDELTDASVIASALA